MLLFTARTASERGRPDGYDELLRSAAVDAFVVTDTYRGNPQAAWLRARGGAVRGVRPALGGPAAPAPLGRRGRPRRGRARGRPPRRRGATSGSPGSAGRRARSSARTAAAAGSTGCTSTACPRAGCSARGEDTIEFGRRAAHALLDDASDADRVRVRQRHRGDGRAAGARTSSACAPGRDVAVVGFDDSLAAQVCTPALTSVRQPLEEVAVEIVPLPRRAASRTGRSREPGRVLTPDAGRARVELTGPGSVPPPPQVDRVVHLGALVAGEHLVGDLGASSMRTTASSVRARPEPPLRRRAASAASRARTRTAPPRPGRRVG